jgi:hypothetical protein
MNESGVGRPHGLPDDSPDGFTDALRTVRTGRGEEPLDVAGTNVFRRLLDRAIGRRAETGTVPPEEPDVLHL